MKTPDYIITELGCPKLNTANNSYMQLAFWNNNNTQDVNSMKYSINSNNTSKLAQLLTHKSQKLLPLRETLAECYTRLLLRNNSKYNNTNNNAYSRSNDSVCPMRISTSAQQQKQLKNKQNEFIKQQQQQRNKHIATRSHYLHSYTTANNATNTTPTSNARLGFNNGTTLHMSNSISADSDLDVF